MERTGLRGRGGRRRRVQRRRAPLEVAGSLCVTGDDTPAGIAGILGFGGAPVAAAQTADAPTATTTEEGTVDGGTTATEEGTRPDCDEDTETDAEAESSADPTL